MTTTRFYLIRHAETVWNREGRVQGFADSPLSSVGEEQARRLGIRFNEKFIDAFYASDAGRCVSTGQRAFGDRFAQAHLLTEWRERNLGDWEGRSWTELVAMDPIGTETYRRKAEFRAPNGETWFDLQKRVGAAMEQMAHEHKGRTVVVVTSGGPVRAAVMAAVKSDPDEWAAWSTWNISITHLEQRDGHWRLITFNDTAHLSGNLG